MRIILVLIIAVLSVFLLLSCKQKASVSLDSFEKKILELAKSSKKELSAKEIGKHIYSVNIEPNQVAFIKENMGREKLNSEIIASAVELPVNGPKRNCFVDTIFCNGNNILRTYEKCLSNPPVIAHSVTGEIDLGYFQSFNKSSQKTACSDSNSCITIYPNDSVPIGLSLLVELPCKYISSDDTLDVKIKLFGKQEIQLHNLTGVFLQADNSQSNFAINYDVNTNSFPIENVLQKHYECAGKCFIKMNLDFSFYPNLFGSNTCIPHQHFLAVQLENSSLFLHDGKPHSINNIKSKISLPVKYLLDPKVIQQLASMKKLENIKKATIRTNLKSSQYCTNPISLNEYVVCDDSTKCGHIAKHTLVLKIPFCSDVPYLPIDDTSYF